MATKRKKPPTITCEFFEWILRQRDGVYYADCRKGKYNLGKFSLGTRDLEEAKHNLSRLDRMMAVEKGLTTDTVHKKEVSGHISIVDGWAAYFDKLSGSEVSGGASAATHKRYRPVRAKHIQYCAEQGVIGWEQVTVKHLRAYSKSLLSLRGPKRRKLASRTIYLELTTLKSVSKFLIAQKVLPETCRLHFPLVRPQGSDTYCYAIDEIKAMLTHCNSNKQLIWLAPILHTLSYTGLRIGEVVSLRQSDLIRDDRGLPKMIHLTDERASSKREDLGGTRRRTKGRKNRMIPIDSALGEVINALPRLANGRLFQGPSEKVLTQRVVRDTFIAEVIEPLKGSFPCPKGEIGFEHGRMHSFRHFFVSRAFICGASEGDIRQWVGHSCSRVVEMYRHLRPEESLRKLESLDLLNVRANAGGLPSQS